MVVANLVTVVSVYTHTHREHNVNKNYNQTHIVITHCTKELLQKPNDKSISLNYENLLSSFHAIHVIAREMMLQTMH